MGVMFSKRLKELRNQKNLTQQEMADFLGITRQGYAKYEHNQSESDHETIKKLAIFFNDRIHFGYAHNQSESDHETIKKLAIFFNVTTDYLLGHSDDPDLTEDEELEEFIKNVRVWYKDEP